MEKFYIKFLYPIVALIVISIVFVLFPQSPTTVIKIGTLEIYFHSFLGLGMSFWMFILFVQTFTDNVIVPIIDKVILFILKKTKSE